MFKRLLKKLGIKTKTTIILKSGKEIVLYTTNVKITHRGNDLQGYTFEGVGDKLFYLRIDEIAAILL